MCLLSGGDDSFAHAVLHEVVVKICARSQAKNQVGNLRFGVFGDVPHVSETIIPVIAAQILLELEWITRKRSENGTHSLGRVYAERVAIAAPANFEFVATSDEVVMDRIEWEQDSHTSVRLGMQHEQVAIVFRADIDPHAVAQARMIFAQPELYGRIALLSKCCHRHVRDICDSYSQREHQHAQHINLQFTVGWSRTTCTLLNMARVWAEAPASVHSGNLSVLPQPQWGKRSYRPR